LVEVSQGRQREEHIEGRILNQTCRICGLMALQEVEQYRTLPRVTSDSKPWPPGGSLSICDECGGLQKVADPKWRGEIEQIYAHYEIYHQSKGAEQPVFEIGNSIGIPRSRKLIEYLFGRLELGQSGQLLDFGCGTGVALRNFAELLPQWRLYGAELSERSLPALRGIPGFEKLYTCPTVEIPGRFDLITLIHSLEHVLEPVATLADLRGRIDGDGYAFVEVPDCARTPYDLVIADHLTHFTLSTLRFAAERAGYRTEMITDALLTKELSWLGRPRTETRPTMRPDPQLAKALVIRHLEWLSDQISNAKRIAANSCRFGIFGTSISATWLCGALPSAASFFVDEDPGRINRTHMGLPILAPDQVSADAHVFIPLIPAAAESVASRLAGLQARFHVPPRIDGQAA
jgi:SAM-dependent methyltransferase